MVINKKITDLSDLDYEDFSLKDFSPIFSSKSKFKKPSLPDYIDKIDGYFIYIHNYIFTFSIVMVNLVCIIYISKLKRHFH